MQAKNGTVSTKSTASVYLIVMFASVSSSIIAVAIVLSMVPLEPWLKYLVAGSILLSEILVLGIFYSLYRKAAHRNDPAFDANIFGARRPDLGSQPPSERR